MQHGAWGFVKQKEEVMIRTSKQYVESLNDGRDIYIEGEKIPDITKDVRFRGGINARAFAYDLYNHPAFKDFLT
ncbi:MAG: hypothetical protein JW950_06470, partial [Deltaproteobacteria bacterium]|nr:hypothetical protein [Deltaproteobacteria bacterium]